MKIKDLILRISYFRNKQNLSARELSLRIGKHEGYINKLESKDFNLTAEMLLSIIDALDISYEEFFADNFMTYKKDKEINSFFKNLSDDSKSIILSLMKKIQ